jgi:hypothetical protein
MTEKEQKILDYIEKRKKFRIEYSGGPVETPEQMRAVIEKNGITKEALTKDIEEYNTLLSDITHDDLKDDKLVGDLQKIRMKFLALRRLCVKVGMANNTELPIVKTLS